MLFTKFTVKKFLPIDILAKKNKKETENLQSNFFGYMLLLSINKQIDNFKQLKQIFFCMLFWLDIKDRKKILDLNLRKKELNKLIKSFSKLKHILMFGKSLWFVYKSLERLEKMVKQKFLDGKKYTKYDFDNKYHVFAALFFCIILNICLKNLIFFLFV